MELEQLKHCEKRFHLHGSSQLLSFYFAQSFPILTTNYFFCISFQLSFSLFENFIFCSCDSPPSYFFGQIIYKRSILFRRPIGSTAPTSVALLGPFHQLIYFHHFIILSIRLDEQLEKEKFLFWDFFEVLKVSFFLCPLAMAFCNSIAFGAMYNNTRINYALMHSQICFSRLKQATWASKTQFK